MHTCWLLHPKPSANMIATHACMLAAVVNGELSTLSLSSYKGKYAVLFFYPKVNACRWLVCEKSARE